MSTIRVYIPPELEKNELAIKRFFDAMVYKLRKNSHKPSFEIADVQHCLSRIQGETKELSDAVAENNTVEVLLESADIANLAMIAATAAIDRGGKGKGKQDPHHDFLSTFVAEGVVTEEERERYRELAKKSPGGPLRAPDATDVAPDRLSAEETPTERLPEALNLVAEALRAQEDPWPDNAKVTVEFRKDQPPRVFWTTEQHA